MNPTRRTATALIAALPWAARAQAPAVLRFGLAPYLSPAALLSAFRPLREQFERRLGAPVEMVTARDFGALADAVRRGDYDLALLPAHLARVAVADWAWQPLARTVLGTEVRVLVREGGPVSAPSDLRQRRIGMLDLQSLTAAVGVQWLRAQGLEEDAAVVQMPSINSALYALARDEVAAVVAAASQLAALPAGTPMGFRPLARLPDIPGPWHVARPALPVQTLARWRDALLAFEPDPALPTTASNVRLTLLSVADTEAIEANAAYLRRQLAARR